MIRVATLALAAASLFSSLAQAQVVNQVQADFGVISPLPYSREFGTTFVRDAVGATSPPPPRAAPPPRARSTAPSSAAPW